MKDSWCLKLNKKILIILILIVAFVFGCIEVYDNKVTDANMSDLCIENWECGDWEPEECPHSIEKQTRTCFDLAGCRTTEFKPETERNCEYTGPCIEDWSCTEWEECENGKQTRECTDKYNCKTYVEKPKTLQVCEVVCKETWSCTSWGECNGTYKERNCYDSHACGTRYEAPVTKELCE